MGKKVQYPNGFVGVAPDKVAVALEKREGYKILGPADAAPPPKKEPEKIDRDKLIKKAIKAGLMTKEDAVGMSDAELAEFVGKDE